MMSRLQRGWWGVFLCGSLHACVSEKLLGDNSVPITLEGGAATVQGGLDDESGPIRFDVTADRIVSPSWRYDFVCDGPCAGPPDVQVAPDGSLWAARLGGYVGGPRTPQPADDRLVFVHLDARGEELARYALTTPMSAAADSGSPLLLDQSGRPYVFRWPTTSNEPNPTAFALRLRGEQIEQQSLPAGFHQGETEYVAGFPDGSFLEFMSDLAVKAARFSASGEKLWQADDLRAIPMQDGSRAPAGPVYLSDGAVVFDGLHKAGPIDAETGLGLTVLGPDGKVRWDMRYYFAYGHPFKELAAGVDGQLIMAGVGSPDQDLGVFVYDRRGTLLRSYRGARVSYHPVGPRALAVDENGDIYVALVVGERNDPKLTVCRLSEQREQPARCLALGLVAPGSRSENAVPLPFLTPRMEVIEPGAVVLALSHVEGTDARLSVVRVDFDAPELSAL